MSIVTGIINSAALLAIGGLTFRATIAGSDLWHLLRTQNEPKRRPRTPLTEEEVSSLLDRERDVRNYDGEPKSTPYGFSTTSSEGVGHIVMGASSAAYWPNC